MKTPIIRFTGSPDSDPAQWLRINELTTQPGPGSAYRVTIEELPKAEVPIATWKFGDGYVAGVSEEDWQREDYPDTFVRFQDGTAAWGSTREEALSNLAKAKARGPL